MSLDRCHCPPFIDGGVLVRQGCTHHNRRAPQPEPEPKELTADEIDLACAWSDYRKDYGVSADDLAAAHKAFAAGWKAAREGDQSGALR